jgi:hypothetical protein
MLLPMLTAYEKEHLSERQPLPEAYLGLSDEEMDSRIAAARAKLGSRVIILGHHYQRDEIIKFADYTATRSSSPASQQASRRRVHRLLRRAFHGRERRRLSAPHQQVILPDSGRRLLDVRHGRARAARGLLERPRADGVSSRQDGNAGRRTRQSVSPSPTSTRPPRSRRSAASAAASSAPRRTPRRR